MLTGGLSGRASSHRTAGYQLLNLSDTKRKSTKNDVKKEVVFSTLLALCDDDICWIICSALSRRPRLEVLLAEKTGQLQECDEAQVKDLEHWKPQRANLSRPLHDVSILQCMAPRIYVYEYDQLAEIQVVRVGALDCRSVVRFGTRDSMAVAGKSYTAVEGTLIFEKGEVLKTASVSIIQDESWNPNREFIVELLTEGLENAKLEPYHCETAVVVLDDSPFPTRKYKQMIWEDNLDSVPNMGLIVEYIKMMWHHDKIKCASIKIILSDLLDNILFLARALLTMYLVDCVLNVQVLEDSLFLGHDRLYALASVAALFVIPQALVHYVESLRPFGLAFESLKLLQKTLFERYLSYSPAAMVQEDVLLAMSRDSIDIVNHIYFGSLQISALMGKVAMVCIIQFAAPVIFNQSIRWLTAIPLCVFPVLMLTFLGARDGLSTRALNKRKATSDAFAQFVEDAVQSQSLVTECGVRGGYLDLCEKKIVEYSSAIKAANVVLVHNKEFAQWLSVLLLAGYVVMGGIAVCDGVVPLGRFVTNMTIFSGMGQVYSDIYSYVLKMQEFTPGLKRLTHLMNVPTEWSMRAEMSRHCHEQSDQLFTSLATKEQQEMPFLDELPICIGGVTFKYATSTLSHDLHSYCELSRLDPNEDDPHAFNFHGHMRIPQGSLVKLVGPHHEGKTTLLKLIGGVLMPKVCKDLVHSHQPFFYVPPHLRSVYVPGEPVFLRCSLFQNLVLGVKRSGSDDSMIRVSKICEQLGIAESVVRCLGDEDDRGILLAALSHTDKLLLSLARALITNPQLLCIEYHWMNFAREMSKRVMHLLRSHVDRRGVEVDHNHRRVRTCIITAWDVFSDFEHIDCVFSVSHAKGIELLHDSTNNGRAT